MMVAAVTERDLIYFTFQERKTLIKLNKIVEIIEENNLNVGQVYHLIGEYRTEISDLSSSDIEMFKLSNFLVTKFKMSK